MFYIFTDHSSLQWIQNVKEDVTPRIWRWTKFLQSYHFEIIHIPGKSNSTADALSRHSMVPSIQTIEHTFDWSQAQDYDADLHDIKLNIEKHSSYVVIKNILYRSFSKDDPSYQRDLFIWLYLENMFKIFAKFIVALHLVVILVARKLKLKSNNSFCGGCAWMRIF